MKKKGNIYFICNASTQEHEVWGGNYPLSDAGVSDLKEIKDNEELQKLLHNSFICSSMQKSANQTAYVLSCSPVYYSDFFNEIKFGSFEEKPKIWDDMTIVYENKISDMPNFCQGDNAKDRAFNAIKEACRVSYRNDYEDIVIFSHKTLIECMVCLAYNSPVDNHDQFSQEIIPGSLTHFTYDSENGMIEHVETIHIVK